MLKQGGLHFRKTPVDFLPILASLKKKISLKRERKGVELSELEQGWYLGGVEGRETVIRVYCIKILFQWKINYPQYFLHTAVY